MVHSRDILFHAALLPSDDELDTLSLTVRMPRLLGSLLHVRAVPVTINGAVSVIPRNSRRQLTRELGSGESTP